MFACEVTNNLFFFFNRNGISFTIWDRWTIYGKEDFTLLDFINAVRVRYHLLHWVNAR